MATGVNAPLYTIDILRLAGSLAPPRALERIDGRAEARAPTCGSTIATEVQLSEVKVEALSQTVAACAFGQAAACLVERHARGRTRADVAEELALLEEWLAGRSDRPPAWPGLDALAPARSKSARYGAILLPFRALLAAIDCAQ